MDPVIAVAIIGIVGTLGGALGGAALGHWSAWKIHRRQIEEENRTRFHDRRIEAYAAFLRTTRMMSIATPADEGAYNKATDAFEECYHALTLIASEEVVVHADKVFLLADDEASANIGDKEAISEKLIESTFELTEAMRGDIGTLEFSSPDVAAALRSAKSIE